MTVRSVYTCDFCGAEEVFNGRTQWAEGWSKIQKIVLEKSQIVAELDVCPREECRDRADSSAMSYRDYMTMMGEHA